MIGKRGKLWLMAAVLSAGPVLADPQTDDLVAQLRDQGFQKVTVTRTLLGRILILGSADEGQREIVLNPNTGEILRDYFRPRADLAAAAGQSSGQLTQREETPVSGGKPGGKTGTDKGNKGGADDDTGTGDEPAPGSDGGGRDTGSGGKTPAEDGA